MSTSTVTMAKKALTGGSSLGGSSLGGSSLAEEGDEGEEGEKGEERKPKTQKPAVKKSHLARAETFKKEFKAKGGLKAKGSGAGSLEMSEIEVSVDDEEK